MTHCTNQTCSIHIICQNKDKPCPANAARTVIVHNGYRTMEKYPDWFQSRVDRRCY